MSTATRHETASPSSGPIPPLRHGDRLAMAEFERRYEAMPHLKKAELLDGIVHIPGPHPVPTSEGELAMSSPVSHADHSYPHAKLMFWLGLYWFETPGVMTGVEGSIRLDARSMPQPDAFLFIAPEHGGQARIGEDDYLVGAPELVAEVSASSASYDLRAKSDAYGRGGVREYLVWRTEDREIDWFALRAGGFQRLEIRLDGLYRSEVFPGLWLDPVALIRGDRHAIREASRRGTDTPEHAAFVETLRAAATPEGPDRTA